VTSLVDRAAVERLLLLAGAIRSGIVDAVAAPGLHSAEDVARTAGADPRACRVVLGALAEEGIVEETGQEYRLSELGRSHLVDPGPEMERFMLLHQVNKVRGWLDLPEVILNGRPLPRDPARADLRSFVMAMGERSSEVIDETVDKCLEFAGPIGTMLDVGGAVGHLARAFSQRGVQATLLDREEVMPLAREFLGLYAEKVELIGGDCHIYGPMTNAQVFAEVFSVLSPGGVIAIQDQVLGRSPRGAMFAVNMLQATEEGGVWSEEEFRDWLQGAGFGDIRVVDLSTTKTQLVLGRRA
jgi:hypothetical protein